MAIGAPGMNANPSLAQRRALRCRARARRLSDPGAQRSTASRWCTSTAPPPRSVRWRCCARSSTTRPRCTPTCIAACTRSARRPPTPTKARARACAASSTRAPAREIIFVRGTTEAINLVANSWGRANLKAGDEILITDLEHHANIVPWQMVCAATGRTLRAAPITASGELDLAAFRELLIAAHAPGGGRARLQRARHGAAGAARSCGWRMRTACRCCSTARRRCRTPPSTCSALDCDFYAFSGHKLYGPTGIGVLYGREALLAAMPPWQGGGDMILSVSIESTTYNELPWKFEAGTPNISGAVGPRRRARLRRGPGTRSDRRARARAARAGDQRAPGGAAGHRADRHRARQGRGGVLHHGGRASARHRHHPRQRGHRGAHRPSLRHAGHGVLRPARHGARLLRLLQQCRRRRAAGRRGCAKRASCSVDAVA